MDDSSRAMVIKGEDIDNGYERFAVGQQCSTEKCSDKCMGAILGTRCRPY
jgi:hypothetical protein